MISDYRGRLVAAIAVVSALAAFFGLTGRVIAFSTAVCLLIGLGFSLGYAAHLRRPALAASLCTVFTALIALFAAAAILQDQGGPPSIVLGLPLQTTLFVWVIWPLGAVMCLLHALSFDTLLLPPESVERIRNQYGPEADRD